MGAAAHGASPSRGGGGEQRPHASPGQAAGALLELAPALAAAAPDARATAEDSRGEARPDAHAVPAALLQNSSGKVTGARKEEGEGVFEIRDYTTASSFERIVHQVALAAKKWTATLKTGAGTIGLDGGQLMREEFEHLTFTYELFFQIVPQPDLGLGRVGDGSNSTGSRCPTTGAGSSAAQPKGVMSEKLGLHTFPTRAHRLHRWFGVHHFVTLSVRDQVLDPDSARTLLSALVLAIQGISQSLSPPLACFVPVEAGRRRRYFGEMVASGCRNIFVTDLRSRVDPGLEHLSGLLDFFWNKVGIGPDEPGNNLTIGARFTFAADTFEPVEDPAGAMAPELPKPTVNGDGDVQEPLHDTFVSRDPVHALHLFCLWPNFPRGSFVDNAVYSELEPNSAPFWKLRVLPSDEAPLPLTQRLRTLLEFRKEAKTVRSAELSVQPQMPKTTLASLSYVIQESLESILLPTVSEMLALTAECIQRPISMGGEDHDDISKALAPLGGAARGSRLARLAELSAGMRCFKGAVMLWSQVLTQMRKQWDDLDLHPMDAASPPTYRVPAGGVRVERFSPAWCLAQQKFEMLQRSIERRRTGVMHTTAPPSATGLQTEAAGEDILNPRLVLPALATEDMLAQHAVILSSIDCPAEKAEFHGRELRSDVAAFKATNPSAGLCDFLAWRDQVQGLGTSLFPAEWLETIWQQVEALPAAEQQAVLFEPEREAEMALHYLENIEGTQLLLQIFRTQLRSTLEELVRSNADIGPAQRVLCDRAVAAAIAAFRAPVGSSHTGSGVSGSSATARAAADGALADSSLLEDFPCDEILQAAVAAVESLETSSRMAASLQAKLPGPNGETLVEELLADGETAVTTAAQRQLVERVFEKSRELAVDQGKDSDDSRSLFKALPLSKEFVILLQPVPNGGSRGSGGHAAAGVGASEAPPAHGVKRMYTEIRDRHLRLAINQGIRLA